MPLASRVSPEESGRDRGLESHSIRPLGPGRFQSNMHLLRATQKKTLRVNGLIFLPINPSLTRSEPRFCSSFVLTNHLS